MCDSERVEIKSPKAGAHLFDNFVTYQVSMNMPGNVCAIWYLLWSSLTFFPMRLVLVVAISRIVNKEEDRSQGQTKTLRILSSTANKFSSPNNNIATLAGISDKFDNILDPVFICAQDWNVIRDNELLSNYDYLFTLQALFVTSSFTRLFARTSVLSWIGL